MQVIAKLNYLRISPRKVRLVANLIKGMDVEEAETQLRFLTKRASKPLLKLLKSAVSNALHNFNIPKENLYIHNILVNEGPSLKRYMPRAMGRADLILKRTSHITIILQEKEEKTKTSSYKSKKEKEKLIKKDLEKVKDLERVKKVEEKIKMRKPEKKIIPKTGLKDIGKRIFRRKSM